MKNIPIPQHWSAQQAVAVLDLLESLYCAIRDTYEQPLREIINDELQRPLDDDDNIDSLDDGTPF
jgi:hypothetical protein